jgi:hypothetical protein
LIKGNGTAQGPPRIRSLLPRQAQATAIAPPQPAGNRGCDLTQGSKPATARCHGFPVLIVSGGEVGAEQDDLEPGIGLGAGDCAQYRGGGVLLPAVPALIRGHQVKRGACGVPG